MLLFQRQGFGIAITIPLLFGLNINSSLEKYINNIIYGMFIALAITLLYYLLISINSKRIKKKQFISLASNFFIIIYGLYLSTIFGGFFLIELKNYLFLIYSLILTFFIFQEIDCVSRYINSPRSHQKDKNFKPKSKVNFDFNIILPFIFLISPLFLFVADALKFTPFPYILFEEKIYKQSTTAFFAVGAIVFAHLTFLYRTYFYYHIFFFLIILMLFLSALGGARGNFVVGLIVILLMFIKNFSKKKVLFSLIVLSSLAFWLSLNLFKSLDEFVIVRRFLFLFNTGTLGAREILLSQSIDLLKEQTVCSVIGCGFNYFQVYYDYNFGMYPHNIFAELLITFGIFLGMILIILMLLGTAYGFFSFYSKNFFYWILLYYLGISLKSGSLIGITSIPVIIFFSYLGICSLKKTLKKLTIN